MRARTAAVVAMCGAVATGGIGIWFWQTEASYHHTHPFTPLAPVLQWAGIGLLVAAVAMLFIGYALFRALSEGEEG